MPKADVTAFLRVALRTPPPSPDELVAAWEELLTTRLVARLLEPSEIDLRVNALLADPAQDRRNEMAHAEGT